VNRAAQELGRLAMGVPKSLTEAERKRRAEALAKAREKAIENNERINDHDA